MKKVCKALAIISVLALALASLAACGGSKESAAEKSSAAASEKAADTEAVTEAPTEAAVDFDKADVTIAEGDYDGMKAFVNDMQAGKYDGKVVKVTGISTRSGMSVKGSIMESDGASSKFGCTYIIKDTETIDAYPAEDARVELVGVVKTGEYDVRYLEVPQDRLTVL